MAHHPPLSNPSPHEQQPSPTLSSSSNVPIRPPLPELAVVASHPVPPLFNPPLAPSRASEDLYPALPCPSSALPAPDHRPGTFPAQLGALASCLESTDRLAHGEVSASFAFATSDSQFARRKEPVDQAGEGLAVPRVSCTDACAGEASGIADCDQCILAGDQDLSFLKRGLHAGLDNVGGSEDNAGHDNDLGRRLDGGSNGVWTLEDDRDMIQPCGAGDKISLEGDSELQIQRLQHFSRFPLQHSQVSCKIHHKRPKVLGYLSRSQASCMGSSLGMLPSMCGSSEQVSLGEERDDHEGFRPVPFSSTLSQSEQEPMESENGGDEEDDSNNGNGKDENLCSMEDNEPRMDLTDDLLHMVFSFLNQTSLCQAAMVCRQWRAASGHEDFWNCLDFEGRKVTQEQVGWLCSRYPRAVELNLKGVQFVDDIVRDAMHSLRGLEKLTLGEGNISDTFFNALPTECPALQQLTITEALLGSGGSHEIQVRHESLRRIQVTKCRVMRIAIRCPVLDMLSLKRTSMASALLHCPRLVYLDVSSCHKLSDAGVRAAATACPSLTYLDISQCSYVSDETLREISVACNNLHTLDASYCPNISLEGVRMPMLTELKLKNCEGINSSSMAALSNCFMLERIELDFCLLLTSVILDLPRLQSISLFNCRKFVDLTLRTIALVNINVATCPVLNRVDITSTALQKLTLQKQQSLTTMALQCPRLREVDLTECDSLTNSICEVFSDGGGCPQLNSLILDNCESLTNVKLSSTSLQTLSLAGCRKISSIDLACSNLQFLYLDGCDHLVTASLAPVGLQSLNLGICPRVSKLKIEAPLMTSLDLKGCGVLCQTVIQCPRLLSLDAFYCSRLEDECLQAITMACPLIQSLILASCPSVGPAGLAALENLSNLTTLDLSYTFLTDLSPVFETCPRLKVLRLLACKYLGDTALDALHGRNSLPELGELDLSYGSLGQVALEGLLVKCPHLTHVSLNGCANLYDLDWESKPPMFESCLMDRYSCGDVSMEDAPEVEGGIEGLKEGEAFSRSLCRGNLAEPYLQVGINELHFETEAGSLCTLGNNCIATSAIIDKNESFMRPDEAEFEWPMGMGKQDLEMNSICALQHLNCVGCPNIRKVVIPYSAGCLHLSSLNLSLSSNIKEVRLECLYLTSLNLSNCTALEELKLFCPRLISLSVQASGIDATELEGAIRGCTALETLDVRNCIKVPMGSISRMRAVCHRLKRLVNTVPA